MEKGRFIYPIISRKASLGKSKLAKLLVKPSYPLR